MAAVTIYSDSEAPKIAHFNDLKFMVHHKPNKDCREKGCIKSRLKYSTDIKNDHSGNLTVINLLMEKVDHVQKQMGM